MPAHRKDIRPIEVVGSVAYVPLTRGFVATIDADDIGIVEGFNWVVSSGASGKFYAGRWVRYPGGKRIVLMHRELLRPDSQMVVDHIDGDGLNNRRNNIRIATRSQNNHNVPKYAGKTSSFKGVCWHKQSRKWRARICFNNQDFFLGQFLTEQEAAEAYRLAAMSIVGSFARFE